MIFCCHNSNGVFYGRKPNFDYFFKNILKMVIRDLAARAIRGMRNAIGIDFIRS